MPKVFISYSHDSKEHCQQVLGLADCLNENDVDCDIDQYINGSPPEGWPLWMERMLEDSTYVLVICTETYLNRVKRQEKPGTGKGVKWESLLTYQDIYDNDSLNRKFVPVIFKVTDAAFIPKPLRAFTHYDLSRSGNYEMMCRYLTGQPLVVKPNPKSKLHLPPSNVQTASTPIRSDRLPTVKGEFFGREAELKLLNEAWVDDGTRIIQFIAPGGTGKTKLLRHWLDHTNDIDALIAWSFYSQGSSEDKQVSASPFFSHTFEKLGSNRSLSSFTTEEDKGEHLADLLRQQRCVLVLDGLEPLQHAGKGMRGELKDRAIRQLLRSLAGQNNGLCIITTRIAVHELSDRAHVIAQNLQNIAPDDGVQLLQSLGVKGSRKELEKAVTEYGCHALALSLLGNVLRLRHKGDVLKRDTLRDLVKADGNRESRHAFKVMQAYEEWFAGEPELALLYLLGLFDHPIGQDVLKVLWDKQIPNLTAGISEDDWLETIITLREEHHLLSQHVKTDGALDNQLDCHPLIREYFGRQLREKQPDAWRQGHTRLYEYYKALPKKEFPDTLEEMQPLFNAVAHGCAAELYQLVIEEVYWLRIKRKGDHYLTNKLGAFSDDLAAVAHFFVTLWSKVVESLDDKWRFGVFGWAGYNLHALARLHESLESAYLAYDLAFEKKKWDGCAGSALSISERLLTLGDLEKARIFSQRSIDSANQCIIFSNQKLLIIMIAAHAQHARVLHLEGETSLALDFFNRAMQLQQKRQPNYPQLYSQPGFFYCDLLLAQGKVLRALRLAKYAFKISRRADGGVGMGMSMLDIALDQLTHGRCFLLQNNFADTALWLDEAIQSFYKSMRQDDLPLGLLARAALYRDTCNPNHDFLRSRQDLQEVYDIAEPSGMRLHLTDYHLEMARLLIAERENPPRFPLEKGEPGGISLQEHVSKAAKLIEETGYKRRLPELQELQHKLSAISELP